MMIMGTMSSVCCQPNEHKPPSGWPFHYLSHEDIALKSTPINQRLKRVAITAMLIGLDTVHHSVISGPEMDQLSELQLEKVINNVNIFYRVTPKHKLTIVKVES